MQPANLAPSAKTAQWTEYQAYVNGVVAKGRDLDPAELGLEIAARSTSREIQTQTDPEDDEGAAAAAKESIDGHKQPVMCRRWGKVTAGNAQPQGRELPGPSEASLLAAEIAADAATTAMAMEGEGEVSAQREQPLSSEASLVAADAVAAALEAAAEAAFDAAYQPPIDLEEQLQSVATGDAGRAEIQVAESSLLGLSVGGIAAELVDSIIGRELVFPTTVELDDSFEADLEFPSPPELDAGLPAPPAAETTGNAPATGEEAEAAPEHGTPEPGACCLTTFEDITAVTPPFCRGFCSVLLRLCFTR